MPGGAQPGDQGHPMKPIDSIRIAITVATLLIAGTHGAVAADTPAAGSQSLPHPAAPTGKAPLGTYLNRSETCQAVQVGGETRYATVDGSWEYRNTRDSDGDGEPDAAPKWALAATSIQYYAPADAAQCR